MGIQGMADPHFNLKEIFMGNAHQKEKAVDLETQDADSATTEAHGLKNSLDNDDDFIDDWISHVDDFDNTDDLNNW